MKTLYHHPICPLSRQIRVLLKEFNVEFSLIKEDYWLNRAEFLKINPAGNVPVILSKDLTISGHYAIFEFLNEDIADFYLMPKNIEDKAKTRELISWFNEKFYREVSKILVNEKMIRLLMRVGEPRSAFIRAAKSNLNKHFEYLNYVLSKNSYLISEQITCADIVAASHISVIDYFGEINWDSWEIIKEWYSIIKSRPSFQKLLQDRVPGFTPSKDYDKLDF